VQILTITFLLTICPCDCLENRHGSNQVFSGKALWESTNYCYKAKRTKPESGLNQAFSGKNKTTHRHNSLYQ
jgi:hypothetical protein